MSSSFTLMRILLILAAAVHVVLPHVVTAPALLLMSVWFVLIAYLLTKYSTEE